MSGAKKGVSFLCCNEANRCGALCLEQQFLKRYSSISLDSCVCKPDELSQYYFTDTLLTISCPLLPVACSVRNGLSISN